MTGAQENTQGQRTDVTVKSSNLEAAEQRAYNVRGW